MTGGDDLLRRPVLGRRLRLGFVGGGRGGMVGTWHLAGARLSGHWDVVAGALSSHPETARLSAADWGIAPDRSHVDFHAMARSEAARADGIEAVVICTPNASHAEIAETFLDAGIDVILDKPMTTRTADARRLVELRRRTGLCLVMTYPYAHHAMVAQARALVDAGRIGAVRHLHVEYLQDWNLPAARPDAPIWRHDPAIVGRNALIGDIGTHASHLIGAMTGLDIAAVRAESFTCGGAKPTADTAHIALRLSNGAPAIMVLSNAAIGQYCGLRIRIWGDEGALEWDQEQPESLRFVARDRAETVYRRGFGQGIEPAAERLVHLPRGHGEALTDAWANLYAEAGLHIGRRRSGKDPGAEQGRLPDARDGLKGMLFIDACTDSAAAGGVWTDLATID